MYEANQQPYISPTHDIIGNIMQIICEKLINAIEINKMLQNNGRNKKNKGRKRTIFNHDDTQEMKHFGVLAILHKLRVYFSCKKSYYHII